MANVGALSGTAFNPVYYEIENDYKNNENADENIFTAAPLYADAKTGIKITAKKEDNGFFDKFMLFLADASDFFTEVFNNIGNFFTGLFSNKEDKPAEETNNAVVNTKDGVIGGTTQGSTGDCWLLSGVNALSYTEEGREIIKDTLDYKDGCTIVHMKGAKDYTVTDEEIEAAKTAGTCAKGDDDMVIFEIATLKALEDIASVNAIGPSELSSYIFRDDKTSITTGGYEKTMLSLLTGKQSDSISDKKEMEAMLDTFQANGNKDLALTASVSLPGDINSIEVENVAGQKVTLYSPHAYAIKKVDDDNVTITNPWTSDFDIVLSRETVVDNFTNFSLCDLSENNTEESGFVYPEINADGDREFVFNEEGSVTDPFGEKVNYAARKPIFKGNEGIEIKTHTYYDENGNTIYECIQGDEDDDFNSLKNYYYKNGTLCLTEIKNKNNFITYELSKLDENGNVIEKNNYGSGTNAIQKMQSEIFGN